MNDWENVRVAVITGTVTDVMPAASEIILDKKSKLPHTALEITKGLRAFGVDKDNIFVYQSAAEAIESGQLRYCQAILVCERFKFHKKQAALEHLIMQPAAEMIFEILDDHGVMHAYANSALIFSMLVVDLRKGRLDKCLEQNHGDMKYFEISPTSVRTIVERLMETFALPEPERFRA